MSDITKCKGTDCSHKNGCYRFTAPADEYQSYFVDAPIKDGRCDMYWGDNAEGIWKQLKDITNEGIDEMRFDTSGINYYNRNYGE